MQDVEIFCAKCKENEELAIADLEKRVAKLESYSELQEEYRKLVIKNRTCDLCGFESRTLWHLDNRHRKSNGCKKRQAANKGILYISEAIFAANRIVTCECGYKIRNKNLLKHIQGAFHKNNLAKKCGYRCDPCGKVFGGKRPKKNYDQHCRGKRHLKKLSQSTHPGHIPTPCPTTLHPSRPLQSVSLQPDQSPLDQPVRECAVVHV